MYHTVLLRGPGGVKRGKKILNRALDSEFAINKLSGAFTGKDGNRVG